jgi:thiamine pyrophosphate-dependent acetolactate synthase large subunit-like protein
VAQSLGDGERGMIAQQARIADVSQPPAFGKILQNGKKIIQIDKRPDAFGWFARVDVGLEGDAKLAVANLLERLQNNAKPRQPAAATALKIKDKKPAAVNYDDEAACPGTPNQYFTRPVQVRFSGGIFLR